MKRSGWTDERGDSPAKDISVAPLGKATGNPALHLPLHAEALNFGKKNKNKNKFLSITISAAKREEEEVFLPGASFC